MAKSLFTKDELLELDRAITTVEEQTSGEIALLVVPFTVSIGLYQWIGALLGSLAVGALALLCQKPFDWPMSALSLFELQMTGAALGATLPVWPGFVRLLPKSFLARKIHEKCLYHFSSQGISNTRLRTGILIYLSEAERSVEILADSGIHKKVGRDFWNEIARGITAAIQQHRAKEGILTSLDKIHQALATHFPPETSNKNELSNILET